MNILGSHNILKRKESEHTSRRRPTIVAKCHDSLPNLLPPTLYGIVSVSANPRSSFGYGWLVRRKLGGFLAGLRAHLLSTLHIASRKKERGYGSHLSFLRLSPTNSRHSMPATHSTRMNMVYQLLQCHYGLLLLQCDITFVQKAFLYAIK